VRLTISRSIFFLVIIPSINLKAISIDITVCLDTFFYANSPRFKSVKNLCGFNFLNLLKRQQTVFCTKFNAIIVYYAHSFD
jgi:hypothetical protein